MRKDYRAPCTTDEQDFQLPWVWNVNCETAIVFLTHFVHDKRERYFKRLTRLRCKNL